MNICSTCGGTSKLMHRPYVTRRNKNGTTKSYFRCNPCHTEAQKKYRHGNGAEAFARAWAQSVARYPHKQKARIKLRDAINVGKVSRPGTCSSCSKACKPDGHHYDYSQPLSVVWLCRQCHAALHRTLAKT